MKLVSSMAGYSRIRATKQKMVANLVTLTLSSSSSSSSRGSCTAHAGMDFDDVRRGHGRYTGHSAVSELSFATCLFSIAGMSRIFTRICTIGNLRFALWVREIPTARWRCRVLIVDKRFRPYDDHRLSSTVGFDRTMIIECLRQSESTARWRWPT